MLCLKLVYPKKVGTDGAYATDAYLTVDGSAFWGGVSTHEAREDLVVQPVQSTWVLEK